MAMQEDAPISNARSAEMLRETSIVSVSFQGSRQALETRELADNSRSSCWSAFACETSRRASTTALSKSDSPRRRVQRFTRFGNPPAVSLVAPLSPRITSAFLRLSADCHSDARFPRSPVRASTTTVHGDHWPALDHKRSAHSI